MSILNLLITLFFFVFPSEKNNWELQKDKDGIKVYTREAAGSFFKEFNAVTIIANTNLVQVLDSV